VIQPTANVPSDVEKFAEFDGTITFQTWERYRQKTDSGV